jgi:hypothetical protein
MYSQQNSNPLKKASENKKKGIKYFFISVTNMCNRICISKEDTMLDLTFLQGPFDEAR